MVSVPSADVTYIQQAATGTGLPYAVVAAQVDDESGFQAGAVSSAGAEGPYQFLPSTFTGLGFPAGQEFSWPVETQAYIAYMKQLLKWAGGDVRKALAAYNAGPGNWQAGLGYADSILRAAGQSPGITASGGGGGAAAAQTTSFLGDVSLNPIGIIEGAWKTITSVVAKPLDIATSVTSLAKDFNALVAMINAVLKDIEWLFVPSNWVRIFCFLFGVGALIPGVWALVKTGSGQQGDITLAIGILMITIGGILLFLAFHNLPTDVQDLGGLLGYISKGVQTGQAPTDAVKTGAA